MKKTHRGFAIHEFKDANNERCSLQKSSSAMEDLIWLGVNNANPQLMKTDAIKLGLEVDRSKEISGWQPYEIPKQVLVSTRMHLTQEQVKSLLPLLQRFADTGELSQ